jgi:hypothetical protein
MLTRDGQVIGFWRNVPDREEALVDVRPVQPLDAATRSALEEELERYGRFMQLPARLLPQPRTARARNAPRSSSP